MSLNPFTADPAIAARYAAFGTSVGERLRADLIALLDASRVGPARNAATISLADAAALIERYGLDGIETLMLLALPVAEKLANPAISGFMVGAVGLDSDGALILGGNVEFPFTHLGTTLHGEGSVLVRAFSRGTTLARLAIGEAHPCAHCRQCLAEFAAAPDLVLIDPLGHRLRLADLYPWPFDPNYLGEAGAIPGATPWPGLTFTGTQGPGALLAAGRKAHTPYSGCPAGVVLVTDDGTEIAGSALESVAFNPTIGPMQAALVNLIATGRPYSSIATVHLGTVTGGAVDYARSTAELLSAVAPAADLVVHDWRPA